jgi:hypothetical protein
MPPAPRPAARLNDPDIVAVYEVGAPQGIPFVVSELLHGNIFRDRLQDGALPMRAAVSYALDVGHIHTISDQFGSVLAHCLEKVRTRSP